MDADTSPSITPIGAEPVHAHTDDDLFIPTEQLLDLQLRIGQLSRRLARLGASPVQLVDTGRRCGSLAIVRLQGQGTRIGDWEIVCVLHHQSGSIRVEPCVPMSQRQLERLAGARALCEACRTVRRRRQTFIVRERQTGRTMQLGSSCLRPLTGTESAEDAIRRAQTAAMIRTVVAGTAQQPHNPGEQYIDTSTFLAHAVSVVRGHGFHRSDKEDATWRTALTRIEEGGEPAIKDLARAREIRDWASQLKERDDGGYQARVAACLAGERLTSRELPLAASAVRAYNRQLYWQIRHKRATGTRPM
jgi:hypothetical protein